MKTLHEIELAAPELFPDILHQLSKNIAASAADADCQATTHAAALAAKDAEKTAAVEAAKRAIQTTLDPLVLAAEAAHAAADWYAIAFVIAEARSYTTDARRARLEAEMVAGQAAVTAAATQLAALA